MAIKHRPNQPNPSYAIYPSRYAKFPRFTLQNPRAKKIGIFPGKLISPANDEIVSYSWLPERPIF